MIPVLQTDRSCDQFCIGHIPIIFDFYYRSLGQENLPSFPFIPSEKPAKLRSAAAEFGPHSVTSLSTARFSAILPWA